MAICDPNAPEKLKRALRNIPDLQIYVKECSMSELLDAMDAIYRHQPVLREIVQDEIDARERSGAAARGEKSMAQAERHHADRQWWTRFSVVVATLSFLLALASFLFGRYLPTSQVAALETRVAAIEHKIATDNGTSGAVMSFNPQLEQSRPTPTPDSSSAPTIESQQTTKP